MRGTLAFRQLEGVPEGIIPAYAGNTRIASFRFRKTWDHPRVCGEHYTNNVSAANQQGSSPRMRGTPNCRVIGAIRFGIIPAYAGNTCRKSLRRFATGDHPRVCGEHAASRMSFAPSTGSSPRMRGTRVAVCVLPVESGIIPAYAGNTTNGHSSTSSLRDHPRVCGEHPTS